MTNKSIIKRIVLSITLAIIAIAITIGLIIIGGISIPILKVKASTEAKTLQVATLQLNKLHLSEHNVDLNNLDGRKLTAKNDLSLVDGLLAPELNDKQLLAKSLSDLQEQLLVSELKNDKSLLLNELTGDLRQLDLDSLQSLLKLDANLNQLG